jgi:hypothetical protein
MFQLHVTADVFRAIFVARRQKARPRRAIEAGWRTVTPCLRAAHLTLRLTVTEGRYRRQKQKTSLALSALCIFVSWVTWTSNINFLIANCKRYFWLFGLTTSAFHLHTNGDHDGAR